MNSRLSPRVPARPRTSWRGGVAAALGCALALLTLAGCGGSPSGGTSHGSTSKGSACPSTATQNTWNLVTLGVLKIDVVPAYFPAEYRDPTDANSVLGYDVDIANAIAQKMCLTPLIEDTENFDAIIPNISQGAPGQQNYDMSISSLTITAERQKSVDMLPYFQAGQSLLLTPNSASGMTAALSTWCGKRIAAQDGTVELAELQDINGGANKSGEKPVCKSKPIKILHFNDESAVVSQVVNGSADASFQDSPVAGYYAMQNLGKVVLGPAPNDSRATLSPEGIMVRKDNAPFEQAVKDALAAIRSDGTYSAILAKWGETAGAYPPLS
jgi:polar amino acid transport system substrate-binding protein